MPELDRIFQAPKYEEYGNLPGRSEHQAEMVLAAVVAILGGSVKITNQLLHTISHMMKRGVPVIEVTMDHARDAVVVRCHPELLRYQMMPTLHPPKVEFTPLLEDQPVRKVRKRKRSSAARKVLHDKAD